MAPKSKQAERNAAKRAAKQPENEEPAASAGGTADVGQLVALCQDLATGACLVTLAPRIVKLLKPPNGEEAAGKAEDKADDKPEDQAEDKAEDKAEGKGDEETELWQAITDRLFPNNVLALATPATWQDAGAKWLAFKELSFDWGPRKQKRGTPALNRVLTNVSVHIVQYLHILLALMMLRALLFRSYFAGLPWFVGFQAAAVMVPLEMVPQVPLKFRIAGAMGFHALVWLFFLLEVVWNMWFIEKFLVIGLLVFHAHSVRPADP